MNRSFKISSKFRFVTFKSFIFRLNSWLLCSKWRIFIKESSSVKEDNGRDWWVSERSLKIDRQRTKRRFLCNCCWEWKRVFFKSMQLVTASSWLKFHSMRGKSILSRAFTGLVVPETFGIGGGSCSHLRRFRSTGPWSKRSSAASRASVAGRALVSSLSLLITAGVACSLPIHPNNQSLWIGSNHSLSSSFNNQRWNKKKRNAVHTRSQSTGTWTLGTDVLLFGRLLYQKQDLQDRMV